MTHLVAILLADSRRITGFADHPAVFELNNPMAVSGVSLRVRNLDDASSSFVQLSEKLHDFFTLRGMQVTGGLVGKNQLGALNDGAGDSHELLLPARKLIGEEVLFANDVKAVEDVADEADALFVGDIFIGEGDFEVLEDRQVVDEVVALENEADIGFVKLIALLYIEAMDRLAVKVVFAGPRAIEHPDNAEKRRLPGSRRSHERNKFTRLNLQGHATQHIKLTPARFVNLLHVS